MVPFKTINMQTTNHEMDGDNFILFMYLITKSLDWLLTAILKREDNPIRVAQQVIALYLVFFVTEVE